VIALLIAVMTASTITIAYLVGVEVGRDRQDQARQQMEDELARRRNPHG